MYRDSAAPKTCKHGYRSNTVCASCIREIQKAFATLKKSIIDVKYENDVSEALETLFKWADADDNDKLKDVEVEEVKEAINALNRYILKQNIKEFRESPLDHDFKDDYRFEPKLSGEQAVAIMATIIPIILVVILCII